MTRSRPAALPGWFKSDQPGLADGAQSRDFIWVGDVVDVMLWLMGDAGGQRPVQPRHRPRAHLPRSGTRGVGRRRQTSFGGLYRHAGQPARDSISRSPRRRWIGCGPPATPASSRRSRKASAATSRTTCPVPIPSYDPGSAVSPSSIRVIVSTGSAKHPMVRAWPTSPAW